MTTDILIAELENIPHSGRVQRMAALGQASRTDTSTAALLQTLAVDNDFYPRFLALLSCYGSGDGERVLQFLSDPSRTLRGLAVKLTPTVCSVEQVLKALEKVSQKTQTVLLRGLIRHRRRDAIDSFLRSLASTDSNRLNELLPFGSEGTVREFLGTVTSMMGIHDWARLARLHPILAAETLSNKIQQQTDIDLRLLSHINAVVPELAESQPDVALDLVREILAYTSPARLALQRLAERKPNEVADILLQNAEGNFAKIDLGRVAHRLSREHLLALLQYRSSVLSQWSTYFRRLSPELRRAAFEVVGRGWYSPTGILAAVLVGLLPKDLREQEARRNLALPALATHPLNRLEYAAFLPWDEATEVLRSFIRNPDAELRARALRVRISVARYYPDHLSDILADTCTRTNEQDPVREAMLGAIAGLPPSRWQASHLDQLGQIVQDALNARDLSPATANHAEKLIVALVPFHPEWAASWLANLVKSRGLLSLQGFKNRLSDADVKRIAPALMPVFQSWETREREPFILQAARGLGKRLSAFDALAALLERVLLITRSQHTAMHILNLLADHRPGHLAALIPDLLQRDPSTITLPVVHEFLHRKRQDLLTPYLGRQAYSGRFSTGKTRFVLPFRTGFSRWTATQQEIFAQTLTEITRDTGRDVPAIHQIMSQLAALPAVPPTRLIELASLANDKTAVRDAALQELARLDGGQGIPPLIEALDDDRARVAIYALRGALLEMPADRALALLKSAPTTKVTVAKEVVRLIGELETPDAYPVLLQMAQQVPPLHRDIHIALLRALWDHIERDETWPVLNQAASDQDATIAMGVVKIPAERISPLAQQRLLHLITVLFAHPDIRVRMAALERCSILPLTDSSNMLLHPLMARLHSPFPHECSMAARALFATYRGSDVSAVRIVIEDIRKNRHSLQAVLQELRSYLGTDLRRLEPTVRAVLDALATDPITAQERVVLAIMGLPWEEVATYLMGVAENNELHADALVIAEHTIQGTRRQFGSVTKNPHVSGSVPGAANALAVLENTLLVHPDSNLRRLALSALLAQASGTEGWTTALRARLEIYRDDPAPLVAAAALFTILPPEPADSAA